MPRPKSNITGLRPKNLSVRWTEEHHLAYLRLGGSGWLRQVIEAELARVGGRASQLASRTKREPARRAGSSR